MLTFDSVNNRYFGSLENSAQVVGSNTLSAADLNTGNQQTDDALTIGHHLENQLFHDDRRIDLADINPNDILALYFRDALFAPLLSAEEEIALAKKIEAGRSALRLLSHDPMSNRKMVELQRLIKAGWSARNHLIRSNYRLVVSIAKKYRRRGLPFLDLIQEGNVGLIRAVDKFDHRRGTKFSTSATWWIRNAVARAVVEKGHIIRISFYLDYEIRNLRKKKRQLELDLGRDPNTAELAEALDVKPERIDYINNALQHPLSLESPVSSTYDNDLVLGDLIQDHTAAQPFDSVSSNLLSTHIASAMMYLTAREARILQIRYGLMDGQDHTLEEVGRKLGITKERVRQIEAKALKKLRHLFEKRKLYEYMQ